MQRALELCLFLTIMLLPASSFAADDFQYWSQGYGRVTAEGNKLSFGVYGEIRMTENATKVFGIFVGPTIGYKINPYLNTAIAAKLLVQNLDGQYEQWQRVDFELNPGITTLLDGHLSLKLRNRVELFRHPTKSDPLIKSTTIRTRHRLGLEWSLDKAGPLAKVYVNNEWFWGQYFRNGKLGFTEDRVTPFGLQFKVSRFAKINVFYLMQFRSDKVDKIWSVAHCLGTFLIISPPRPASS